MFPEEQLDLAPVIVLLNGSYNGLHLDLLKWYISDPLQDLQEIILLQLQLLFVKQALEHTSPATVSVWTDRSNPERGFLLNRCDLSKAEAPALLCHLDPNDVSGQRSGHKANKIIPLTDTKALRKGNVNNLKRKILIREVFHRLSFHDPCPLTHDPCPVTRDPIFRALSVISAPRSLVLRPDILSLQYH